MLSRRFVSLWIIVLVNVTIAILYVWSRGGATTTVRIEVIGNHYRAYVDGELALQRAIGGRPEGGIGFLLRQEDRLPALPSPHGIDSVRVTDAATDDVLFEDSFDGAPSARWQYEEGTWRVDDGVFTPSASTLATIGFQPWRDYVMEATLRNITEAIFYVRSDGSGNAIAFDIGPLRSAGGKRMFRLEDGTEVDKLIGLKLQVSRVETVRSMVAMLLRPYPIAIMMIVGAGLVALLLRFTLLERLIHAVVRRMPIRTIVVGLSLGAFLYLLYLIYVVGDAMPHVPDSILYVFQAKTFSSLHVTADAPPARENFSIFFPHFLHVVDGRWFGPYPFGHSLFLAVGQLFGAVWLIPPLLGSISVALMYWVGKRIYGIAVGLAAAVLLFSSPFFLMTASNFMSHNTAAFTILAVLFLMTSSTKHRLPAMLGAGVFIGLLFNMRPLTAAALMPVLGGLMAYELARERHKRGALLREDFAFAAGALLMFGAYLLFNQLTSGDPLTTTYAVEGDLTRNLGFDGPHSVGLALQNQQRLLSLLLLVVNGWPLSIGLTLVALPFLTGRSNKWDVLFGASALSIVISTMLFANAGVMHGPRYWYEAMPFLILLTARGAQCLGAAGSQLGDGLQSRFWRGAPPASPATTNLAVYALVAALVGFSLYGWFGQREAWAGDGITRFTPAKASQLEGFNSIDSRLGDLADDMEIENALVFVEDCGLWHCYASVFWRNSPALDGEVVWAKLTETQDDIAVLDHFPDRSVYIADYFRTSIAPASIDEITARLDDVAESVVVEDRQEVIDSLTSTPEERDLTRIGDLERVRQALELCADTTGSYPDTSGQLLALSVVARSGSACLLRGLLPDIPRDPLGDPIRDGYWFRSDGTTYLLVALREVSSEDRSGCPVDVEEERSSLGRMCVTGSLP